jgi:glutamate--cysteine ligase
VDEDPVTQPDLIEYFEAGAKPPDAWRVGGEFEKFALDRTTGRQIGFDNGIEAVLRELAKQFGWTPHEESGRVTTLTRGGSTISIEPGGQIELSTPPARHISELRTELDRHLAELRTCTDPARYAWVAAGVTPYSTVGEITLNPRPRHRLMAEYLPTKCRYALHMMKATASTQATFDYADEADAGRKFSVALTLAPIVNAAFANAPLHEGKGTRFASFRGEIWQGMDPDRSGFLVDLLRKGVTFENWVAFVVGVPVLFIDHHGELRPAPGITFQQWMDRGVESRYPTLHDWEIHLSTTFTEVRLKQFMEVRGADANPAPLALAVPTIWKGLLYDADALSTASAIAREIAPADLPRLALDAARDGLRALYRGRRLSEWCRDVLAASASGLARQSESSASPDESSYLEPMREVLASGRSPGELWPDASDLEGTIRACEYRA